MGCKGVFITRTCFHDGKGYNVGWFLMVIFFKFFFLAIVFSFFLFLFISSFLAIFDLVYDVRAIFRLSYVLASSLNLF